MIPLFTPSWDDKERRAVQQVLEGDYLNEGKYVREFESKFAEYVGARHCILVPNGAQALYLAVKVEDEMYTDQKRYVLGDHYSIFAANALWMIGERALLMDVSLDTACLPEVDYRKFAIHVNGRQCPVSVIEDCCQRPNHHTKGATSCYSFHSTKMMTCAGIGGAVCCDDKETFLRMAAIKDHGRPERAMGNKVTDVHAYWGTNMKMSDVNAAFGLVQLAKLPDRFADFRAAYRIYQEELGDLVKWFPSPPAWRVDCLVEDPDGLIQWLAKSDIEAKRFYLPTSRQAAFFSSNDFKNSNYLYRHGIYLPSSPSLTDEAIVMVSGKIKEYIAGQ